MTVKGDIESDGECESEYDSESGGCYSEVVMYSK